MKNTTRLVLIHLLENALDDLNAGNSNLNEEEGLNVIESLREIMYPKPKLEVYNITQACTKLNLSQPTFRKYVKEGKIPEGQKIGGFREKVWDKKVIDTLDL